MIERICALEQRVIELQQQISVLQKFTGLRETLEHNLKKFKKAAYKRSQRENEK